LLLCSTNNHDSKAFEAIAKDQWYITKTHILFFLLLPRTKEVANDMVMEDCHI
jgi:hypothetical protein